MFDVVGVVACFVLFFLEETLYVVWFVLGIFCGSIAYGVGGSLFLGKDEAKGEWTDREDASRIGGWVIGVPVVLLSALSVLFYRLWWRFNPSGDYFVPASAAPTLTFFGAILAAMVLFLCAMSFKPSDKGDRR